LELHAFTSDQRLIHAAWTINARATALADIYTAEDLSAAQFITRDGKRLKVAPDLATESPLYLQWPLDQAVTIKPDAGLIKNLSIHAHTMKTHVLFRQNGWQGMLLAGDDKEAALHPEHIGTPPSDALLRDARNAVWTIPDPRSTNGKLVVKQPVKMRFYKKLLGRFRPSKALRSWNGASELLRRGIETAHPVAYFEKIDDASLTQNYYICEYVKADFTARKIFSAFAAGDKIYQGATEEDVYRQLCDFLFTMHNRGIFFRDLSGGNILIRKSETNTLIFSLIDTGRVHFFNHATPLSKRISDLARVCNKLHSAGRDRFMTLYMEKLGRRFGFWQRIPFYLYNTKVILKRRLKRKNLIKLFK
jgi:tRNA A-37 threonylcarbamoyl transferase component Bud32